MFEPIGRQPHLNYTGQGVINPPRRDLRRTDDAGFFGETTAAKAIETAVIKITREKIKSLAAGKMGFSTSQVAIWWPAAKS